MSKAALVLGRGPKIRSLLLLHAEISQQQALQACSLRFEDVADIDRNGPFIADHAAQVRNLLARLCTLSVETRQIVVALAA